MISAFLLVLNEEELLPYCLESFALIADQLDILSVVDNGSTDASMDILDSYKDKLPIIVQREVGYSHHGNLRNLALSKCHGEWILYLDSDETWGSNFRDWLRSDAKAKSDVWEFQKWSTIVDCYHHAGGEGPSQRLFRNLSGVGFPQNIHTEPTHPALYHRDIIPGVFAFDHTGCKSEEALWSKGFRYSWANREGVVGVGPSHEYIGRLQDAHARETIRDLPENVKQHIFTGPGFRKEG